MANWYRDVILDTGRSGVFWLLVAFVLTFGVTRAVTRHIHARGSAPADETAQADEGGGLIGDIHIGGVHVHHQVWGILLVLTSAVVEFAYRPDSPWLEILGAAFGAGAALTLDEFALWLHLDDVYWSPEGRKSIDAVVIAVCFAGVLLIGTTPFGVDETTSQDGLTGIAIAVAIALVFTFICIAKGKLLLGVFGLIFPLVSFVGALRIARPDSAWARRFYAGRPRKREKAERRAARHDRRMDRLRDLLGGAAGA